MSIYSQKSAYISNKIKHLRESAGWSQSELARRTQVTSSAISQIEKGDRMPSLIVLRKLAEAFNISVTELTGDSLPSSVEIDEEAQAFFRKFGNIKELSEADQKMIQSLVDRLKGKQK